MPAGHLDLVDSHLGQADLGDLAFVLEFPEGADLVLGGELRVDPVELEQVDLVHSQPAEAHLQRLSQVVRLAELVPVARTGPQQAGLGRRP